jgi:hypothetical protein
LLSFAWKVKSLNSRIGQRLIAGWFIAAVSLLAGSAPAFADEETAPLSVTEAADAVTAGTGVETAGLRGGQNHRFLAGMFFEYNSAWEPGVSASYSNTDFSEGKPRLQLAYATTRLYTAAGSRTLNEDRLRLLAGWYFRPGQRVNPSVNLGLGYTRFDYEDDAFSLLDNDAWGALLQSNLEIVLLQGLRAYGTFGLELLSSSTVYPVSLGLGLHYDLSEVLP